MNKELESYLALKFPKIFLESDKKTHRLKLSGGISCGDGWFGIINDFCSIAQNRISYQKEAYLRYEKNMKLIQEGKISELSSFEQNIYKKEGKLPEVLAPSQIVVTQVKEKFGELRFYYSGGDKYIEGLSSYMHQASKKICEICGKEGKLYSSGWLKTLCVEHAKENHYDIKDGDNPVKGSIISVLSSGGEFLGFVENVISDSELEIKVVSQVEDDKANDECITDIEGGSVMVVKVDGKVFSYWKIKE